MSNDITNFDDVIDSRDVIARIEELEAEREALAGTIEEAREALAAFDPSEGGGEEAELQQNVENAKRDLATWDASAEAEELAALKALAKEAEDSPNWSYGETLIRDSYFKDYAEELAYDVGSVSRDMQWPLNHIDWDAAANALKMDYSSVDFAGVTYWIRS